MSGSMGSFGSPGRALSERYVATVKSIDVIAVVPAAPVVA